MEAARKKVLILDDEPDVVTYLKTLLEDNGYETRTAGDGRQGLELLKRERPDLVTLDISMPECSGARFYKEMRSDPALASTPVVIVTAVVGLGGDPHAYEHFISNLKKTPPPEAYFPKPIDKDEFLAAIRKLLSRTPAVGKA